MNKMSEVKFLDCVPQAKSYWIEIEKSNGCTVEISEKSAESVYNKAQIMGQKIFFKVTNSGACFIQFEDRSTVGRCFNAVPVIKNENLLEGDMEETC